MWRKEYIFSRQLISWFSKTINCELVYVKIPLGAAWLASWLQIHWIKKYFVMWDFPGGSVGKESACNAGDPGLFPESGRSPGEENGNPLQYSCLENPMGRGAWWATVHGVARVGQDWASKSSPPPLCDVLENWRVLLRVLRKFNWKLININIKGKEGYFLWEKKSCVLI